jgi:hypothetical protein
LVGSKRDIYLIGLIRSTGNGLTVQFFWLPLLKSSDSTKLENVRHKTLLVYWYNINERTHVRFEVIITVKIPVEVFWVVMPTFQRILLPPSSG